MAITTRDGLIAAVANGRTIQFQKASIGSLAASYWTLFRTAGMPGTGPTAAGTSGVQMSSSTQGALPILAPSAVSYCDTFECVNTAAGNILIADRLVEYGGFSAIVTTAQTVGTLALPSRATGATDVELWLEIFVATGATASGSVTASYTNSSGVSGRTATVIGGLPASAAASRMFPFALQAGDTGVQSVQTLTIGTSTATAGNVGLVLRRTLLTGTVPQANLGFQQGWAETSLQIIPDNACLEIFTLAFGTATGNMQGAISIAQG